MKNRFVATVTAVVTALLLAACGPLTNGGASNSSSGPGVAVPPVPPPLATPVGPGGVKVLFLIETFDEHKLPTVRDEVLMIVTAFDASGRIGKYTDKTTGEQRTGPQSYYQKTPWPYTATLGTGIVSVSVSAVFSGARQGEGLKCSVEVDGTLLEALGQTETVRVPYGSAQVTCLYFLPPGSYPIP